MNDYNVDRELQKDILKEIKQARAEARTTDKFLISLLTGITVLLWSIFSKIN